MESAAVPTPSAGSEGTRQWEGVEDKGLKKNAIGFVSSMVIGVASTAPGYSLAAESTWAMTLIGLVWIVIMTAIVVIGIGLSARRAGDRGRWGRRRHAETDHPRLDPHKLLHVSRRPVLVVHA